MNHQPFEQWILSSPELSDAERQSLAQHLEGCVQCRQLHQKWTALTAELRTPELIAPRAGFSRRWQAGIAERRLREQRRQAWRFFLACSGAATAVFLFTVGYFWLTSTPAEWVQAAMQTLTSTSGTLAAARNFASAWLSMTPLSLNVVIWLASALSFSGLAFIWVFAIYRTAFAGVWNK